jgi:hypothetical protein
MSCRRQPSLCMPMEHISSSVRVQRTLPVIAFSRNVSTTSEGIEIDKAQAQTSSQVQSCNLYGSLTAFGLVGVVGAKLGPSASSSRQRVHSTSCGQSSTGLGSAVPPVLSLVTPVLSLVTPSIGLAGSEGFGDSSISSAPLPIPTKTQSLLYLSHMLERPALSHLALPADPEDSL